MPLDFSSTFDYLDSLAKANNTSIELFINNANKQVQRQVEMHELDCKNLLDISNIEQLTQIDNDWAKSINSALLDCLLKALKNYQSCIENNNSDNNSQNNYYQSNKQKNSNDPWFLIVTCYIKQFVDNVKDYFSQEQKIDELNKINKNKLNKLNNNNVLHTNSNSNVNINLNTTKPFTYFSELNTFAELNTFTKLNTSNYWQKSHFPKLKIYSADNKLLAQIAWFYDCNLLVISPNQSKNLLGRQFDYCCYYYLPAGLIQKYKSACYELAKEQDLSLIRQINNLEQMLNAQHLVRILPTIKAGSKLNIIHQNLELYNNYQQFVLTKLNSKHLLNNKHSNDNTFNNNFNNNFNNTFDKLISNYQALFSNLLNDLCEENLLVNKQLHFIFGKRGAGKTAMLNQLIYELNKQGFNCYIIATAKHAHYSQLATYLSPETALEHLKATSHNNSKQNILFIDEAATFNTNYLNSLLNACSNKLVFTTSLQGVEGNALGLINKFIKKILDSKTKINNLKLSLVYLEHSWRYNKDDLSILIEQISGEIDLSKLLHNTYQQLIEQARITQAQKLSINEPRLIDCNYQQIDYQQIDYQGNALKLHNLIKEPIYNIDIPYKNKANSLTKNFEQSPNSLPNSLSLDQNLSIREISTKDINELLNFYNLSCKLHYRSNINDFAYMFEEGSLNYGLYHNNELIGGCQLIFEQLNNKNLAQATVFESRLPKGNLGIQQLLLHKPNIELLVGLASLRISRIFIDSEYQQKHLSKLFINKLIEHLSHTKGINLFTTSYSYSYYVSWFWQKLGFTPIAISQKLNKNSAMPNHLLIKILDSRRVTSCISLNKLDDFNNVNNQASHKTINHLTTYQRYCWFNHLLENIIIVNSNLNIKAQDKINWLLNKLTILANLVELSIQTNSNTSSFAYELSDFEHQLLELKLSHNLHNTYNTYDNTYEIAQSIDFSVQLLKQNPNLALVLQMCKDQAHDFAQVYQAFVESKKPSYLTNKQWLLSQLAQKLID